MRVRRSDIKKGRRKSQLKIDFSVFCCLLLMFLSSGKREKLLFKDLDPKRQEYFNLLTPESVNQSKSKAK